MNKVSFPIRYTRCFLALFLLFLIPILAGCGLPGDKDQPNPTLTALSQAIAGTSTAENVEDSSGNELATAEAKATVESDTVFATQTSQSVGQDESTLATATIAAPIVAELPVYGLDESSGRAGWVHNPLTLETTGYQEMAFGNDYMNVTAADFVLASDIYWDTQYGSSACGFMFRSNGDQNKPSQYMVLISRFANGRAIFTAVADGEIANFADFYPKDNDKIAWQSSPAAQSSKSIPTGKKLAKWTLPNPQNNRLWRSSQKLRLIKPTRQRSSNIKSSLRNTRISWRNPRPSTRLP